MGKRIRNLTGRLFTHLEVIGPAPRGSGRWLCKCSCGNTASVRGWALVNGKAKSCGCMMVKWFLSSEKVNPAHIAHGFSAYRGTPTHTSWKSMIKRCTNPNDRYYHNYGGRGISVCERWRNFANFLADMGERPDGLTLDRIDTNGNYEPGNCRWSDAKTQAQNRRPRSKKKPAPDWLDELESLTQAA